MLPTSCLRWSSEMGPMAKRICVRVASSLMNERRMASGAIESTVRTSLAVGVEPVICEVIDATLVELTSSGAVPPHRSGLEIRHPAQDVRLEHVGRLDHQPELGRGARDATQCLQVAQDPTVLRNPALGIGFHRHPSHRERSEQHDDERDDQDREWSTGADGGECPGGSARRAGRRCPWFPGAGVGHATRARPASGRARRRTRPRSRSRATRRSRAPWGHSTFATRGSRPRLRSRPP